MSPAATAAVTPGTLSSIATAFRGKTLKIVVGYEPGGGFDLKEARRKRVAADKAEALHDADEIATVCPTPERVLEEFSAARDAAHVPSTSAPKANHSASAAAADAGLPE